MKYGFLIGSLMVLLAIAIVPAWATPVTIANYSFEYPQTSGTITKINDWTQGSTGTSGVWHPSFAVPDQSQIAYLTPRTAGTSFSISQTLKATVVAGATYTLGAWVRKNNSYMNYAIDLYAVTSTGDVSIAHASGTPATNITWYQALATSIPVESQYANDPLKIVLSATRTQGSSGDMDFDLISLNYSAVPIPATLVLFGTGLLGLTFWRGRGLKRS